jgi:hypothetical protein
MRRSLTPSGPPFRAPERFWWRTGFACLPGRCLPRGASDPAFGLDRDATGPCFWAIKPFLDHDGLPGHETIHEQLGRRLHDDQITMLPTKESLLRRQIQKGDERVEESIDIEDAARLALNTKVGPCTASMNSSRVPIPPGSMTKPSDTSAIAAFPGSSLFCVGGSP